MKKNFYFLMVLFPIFIILFISLTVFVLGNKKFSQITESYNEYIVSDFLNDNKKEIKEKVSFINSIIKFENEQTEEILKRELIQMMDITYQTIDDIYKKNKDRFSKDEIRKKAIDAISSIRYNENRGYFYVTDYTTNIMLWHPLKSFLGRDVSKSLDLRGKNRTDSLKASIPKDKKFGFTKFYFYKPNDTENEYLKLSGAFHYKPLDIMVGTGEYIDTVEQRLKKSVLSEIKLLNQNQKSKNIMVFENKNDLKALIDENGDGSYCDFVQSPDEHLSYLRRLSSDETPDNGYFQYEATNHSTKKVVTKYIYYKYYKQWDWLIYSGFYKDEMDSSLDFLQDKIKKEEKSIFASSMVAIASVTVMTLLVSFLILNKFKNIFVRYTKEINNKKDELEVIFSTIKDGIAILDKNTKFLYFNEAYLKMLGYTKEELLCTNCLGLTAPEDIKRVKDTILLTKKNGFVENFEKTYLVKANRRVTVNMALALMPDKESLLISIKDITEAKRKEQQINNYISTIDKNIITSSTDVDGKITHVSKAFSKISGYTKEELLGQEHSIMRHPDTPKKLFKELWQTIQANNIWQGEMKNIRKDGSFYWIDMTISPNFDEYGHKTGYTAIRHDVTNQKLVEELSITDSLTEVFNRRYFDDIIPKIINSAKRKNELLSFIIMDIDHFKQYNDTYGHQAGDEALKGVAKCVKENLNRADDHCFRLGGEEFGVVFKSEDINSAVAFANKIKQNIEDLHIEHEKNTASKYISVSMGLICEYASRIKDKDELYKIADDLLYKAKDTGRNKVCTLLEKE